jgi:glyoxylase-like metal-dependent hydrolase (beta-lactamase superfamily II)
MQVAEGIHKVDGVRISNAYLVVADEGLLLVDSGMGRHAGRIMRLIDSLARRPEELRYVVLTHWHIDHLGSVAEVKRLTGARVAIHELDAPVLAGGELPKKGRRAMGLMFRLFRFRPIEPDLRLRDGDTIGGLRVLHVPGHTDGSIALLRDDGVAFTGDALLGDRHGQVKGPDLRLSLDPERATASAEKLQALPISLVLPGHGAPARLPSGDPRS